MDNILKYPVPAHSEETYIKNPQTGYFAKIEKHKVGLLLVTGSGLVYEFDGSKMAPLKHEN